MLVVLKSNNYGNDGTLKYNISITKFITRCSGNCCQLFLKTSWESNKKNFKQNNNVANVCGYFKKQNVFIWHNKSLPKWAVVYYHKCL